MSSSRVGLWAPSGSEKLRSNRDAAMRIMQRLQIRAVGEQPMGSAGDVSGALAHAGEQPRA